MHYLAQAAPGFNITVGSPTPTPEIANPMVAAGFVWTFGILWLLITFFVAVILAELVIWVWRLANRT